MTHLEVGSVEVFNVLEGQGAESVVSAGPDAWISPHVTLGNRVVVEAGARLLAPADLTEASPERLIVGDDVIVGAGALVAGAKIIGPGARVRPGSVVTSDVPPHAVVAGNPAVVTGYSTPPGSALAVAIPEEVVPPQAPGSVDLVGGAKLSQLPTEFDLRGGLTHAELGSFLPFAAKRIFMVHSVPTAEVRGEHAHRTCHQFLICPAGRLRVSLTDGRGRQDVVLDRPSVGLHLPTMVWATQFQYSDDAVLVVLCSERYDPSSYIRDYAEFDALVR